MPDAPATNNAQQDGRREGSGMWGMLQVRSRPRDTRVGKLTEGLVIASPDNLGGHAIWCVRYYSVVTRGSGALSVAYSWETSRRSQAPSGTVR